MKKISEVGISKSAVINELEKDVSSEVLMYLQRRIDKEDKVEED